MSLVTPLPTNSRAIVVSDEALIHVAARERLLDRAFGRAARKAKTSEKLREDRLPAEGLALVATAGDTLVGTLRLWDVSLGEDRSALLLGPLAVDTRCRKLDIGSRLMTEAIARARAGGHQAIILVGDEPYYARFGFSSALTKGLDMPGPVDRARFLGLELVDGALDGASGMITATGRIDERLVRAA